MTILSRMEIDANSLAAILRTGCAAVLVVDCRCFAEFNQSHVRSAVNAFYSKLMRRRLMENKVDPDTLVNQIGCHLNKEETQMVDVVLYGEEEKPSNNRLCKRRISSCNAPESNAKMIKVLKLQLDEANKFRSVRMLEGGFSNFRAQFPQLCDSSDGMSRIPASLSQPCLSQPQTDGPTKITSFLFLGSQQDALDSESLKKHNITHVINLSVNCPRSDTIVNDENFMRIPVNDSYQEKLSLHFENAYNFIERVRQRDERVLIHCLAGISRSPTLAISYVMRHKQLSSDDAYKFVKERRPTISPNFNFMGQLLEYENQLVNKGLLNKDACVRKNEKSLSLKCDDAFDNAPKTLMCPAKVPKSASSHCVYFDPTRRGESPSDKVNENGKRFMQTTPPNSLVEPDTPERPRDLDLSSVFSARRPTSVLPAELPSPSTELSRLSFDGESTQSPFPSVSNPCFVSPMASCSRSVPASEAETTQTPSATNPVFERKCEESSSNRLKNIIPSFFKKAIHRPIRLPTLNSSRPDCLVAAGVPRTPKTSPSLATTTEEEADSPESGYGLQDSCKTDEDRISISSTSSVEIAVQ